MNDVVTLIDRIYKNDDFGVQQIVEERRREVLCDVQSANRAEFFAGMQAGLSPERQIKQKEKTANIIKKKAGRKP